MNTRTQLMGGLFILALIPTAIGRLKQRAKQRATVPMEVYQSSANQCSAKVSQISHGFMLNRMAR
ncbi:hypothetical protein P4S55_13055 [Shewanella sp. PP-Sp27a-2]